MSKKEREQFEFIQRMVMILASGVVEKRWSQTRVATEALARECGMSGYWEGINQRD